jgi:hypothetical protein
VGLGEVADLGERVDKRLAIGVARFGKEPGMEHQVGETEILGALQGPLKSFETLGPSGRIAEAARFLNVSGGGVVLAGEAEHGPRHVEAGGASRGGHPVSLVPCRVMRVAARDLHHVATEAVQKAL